MFKYDELACEEVRRNPSGATSLLRDDPKFNYVVHKYIGFQKGGYTSTTQAQASNDVNRLAVVLTNYNGGTRPLYSNSTYIQEETAVYAKTGVNMQSVTTCP
jgi:hypothetical protein